MAKKLPLHRITAKVIIDTELLLSDCTPEQIMVYEDSSAVRRLGKPEEMVELVLFLVANVSYECALHTGASIDITAVT